MFCVDTLGALLILAFCFELYNGTCDILPLAIMHDTHILVLSNCHNVATNWTTSSVMLCEYKHNSCIQQLTTSNVFIYFFRMD